MATLNKKSGLLGITGFSSDLRDIEAAAKEGDERAQVALDVFASRIHKYVGSYAARMGGLDAIVFTAGIGENSATIRERVLKGLSFMGVDVDLEKIMSAAKKRLLKKRALQLKSLSSQPTKKS